MKIYTYLTNFSKNESIGRIWHYLLGKLSMHGNKNRRCRFQKWFKLYGIIRRVFLD